MRHTTNLKVNFLYPGTIIVATDPQVISTILGSCISVCLWDKFNKIGGMNHYLLPLWNGEGLASPKYGNIAMKKLLEKMLHAGANKNKLVAKVFGGGEVLKITSGALKVGERNAIYSKESLKEFGIPIVGQSVGGKFGRKIHFNTESGIVSVKNLNRIDSLANRISSQVKNNVIKN